MKLNRWKQIGIVASVVWMLGAGLVTYKVQVNDDTRSAVLWRKECNSINTGMPGRANECDAREQGSLAATLPSAKYVAAAVAFVPVPLGWGFAYLALFVMRWFAVTGPVNRRLAQGLVLSAVLVTAKACWKHPEHPATVIWVGNADIEDDSSKDAVSAFANAFAVEPACRGLTLSLNGMPSKPYWFLETYSASTSQETDEGAPYKLSWWMVLSEADGSDRSRVNSDANRSLPKQAVQDVCFIANQKGGVVR
jgi:hypothetical protein